MKTIWVVWIGLTVAVAFQPAGVCAEASNTVSLGVMTRETLDEWVVHYYERPHPELMTEALRFVDRADLLSKKTAQTPLLGFLTIVFRDNADKLPAWFREIDALGTTTRRIVWLALWLSKAKPADSYLKAKESAADKDDAAYLRVLMKKRPFNLMKRQIATPADVDLMWGAFLASGDAKYVRRIISVLPACYDLENINKRLTAEAAKWSLISNAAHHTKVLQTCREEFAATEGRMKSLLGEVVKAAQEPEEKGAGK